MKSPSLLDLIAWGTVAGLLQDWVAEGVPTDDSTGFVYMNDLGETFNGLGRFSQKIDCKGGGDSHENKLQPLYFSSSYSPSAIIDLYSVLPSSEAADISINSLIADQDSSLLQYLVYWIVNSKNSDTPAKIKWPYGWDNATLLDYGCGDNAKYDGTEYFSPSNVYLIGDSGSDTSFYDNIDLSELTFKVYKKPPVYDGEGNIVVDGVLAEDEYGYEATESASADDETDSDSTSDVTETSISEEAENAIGNGLDNLTFNAGSAIDLADFTEAGPFSFQPNVVAAIENPRDINWDYSLTDRGKASSTELINSDTVAQFQFDFVQGFEAKYSLGASSTSSVEVTNASSTSYSDTSTQTSKNRAYVAASGSVSVGMGANFTLEGGRSWENTTSEMTELYTDDQEASYKGSTKSYSTNISWGSYSLEQGAGGYDDFLKYIFFEDDDTNTILFPGDSVYQQITKGAVSTVSYGSIPLLRSGSPIGGSSVQADNQEADYVATTSKDIADLAKDAIEMDYMTNWVGGGVTVPEDSSLYDSIQLVTIDGEDYVQTDWNGDFTTSDTLKFTVNTTVTPDSSSLRSRIGKFSANSSSYSDLIGSLCFGRSKLENYSEIYDFDGFRRNRLSLLSDLVDKYGNKKAPSIDIHTPGINWSFSRDDASSDVSSKDAVVVGTGESDIFDFSASNRNYLFKLNGNSNQLRGGIGRDLVDATESDFDSIFTGDGSDVVKDGLGTTYLELGRDDDQLIFRKNSGGLKTVLTGDGADQIKIRSIQDDSEFIASVNDFSPGEDTIQSFSKLKCSLASLSRGKFVNCGS